MFYKIIITNWFIPERFGAYTIGPVVLIRPEFQTRQGLVAHELTHVQQWWKNPLMGLWYKFSARARYQYELEAHQQQARLDPGWRSWMPEHLLSNYNLGSLKLTRAKVMLDIAAGLD